MSLLGVIWVELLYGRKDFCFEITKTPVTRLLYWDSNNTVLENIRSFFRFERANSGEIDDHVTVRRRNLFRGATVESAQRRELSIIEV